MPRQPTPAAPDPERVAPLPGQMSFGFLVPRPAPGGRMVGPRRIDPAPGQAGLFDAHDRPDDEPGQGRGEAA